jgi:hypothetical protein
MRSPPPERREAVVDATLLTDGHMGCADPASIESLLHLALWEIKPSRTVVTQAADALQALAFERRRL